MALKTHYKVPEPDHKNVASYADVLRGSSHVPDKPLRTSAWEANKNGALQILPVSASG